MRRSQRWLQARWKLANLIPLNARLSGITLNARQRKGPPQSHNLHTLATTKWSQIQQRPQTLFSSSQRIDARHQLELTLM